MWRPRVKHKLDRLRRYRHIVGVLMKYGLEEAAEGVRSHLANRFGEKAGPVYVKKAAEGHSRPARLRLALEEMGPTFIKFGQLLSTRPDLIAPEYVHELERLQDQVKPDPFERIRAEVERELDGPLEEIFKVFDPIPLAAGSIAHVHRAVTHDDEVVAVKIRRPDIVHVLTAECEILEELSAILKATFFEHDTVDPQQMVREFVDAVMDETDLANERRNQLRFAKHFAEDPHIHIARVYEEYCTPAILTMEFIDGVKPGERQAMIEQGFDTKLLAQRGADLILREIFEMGLFHADPHPGNFFLLPDNALAPIDFGQVARLSSQDRRLFNEIVLAIVEDEVPRVVRSLQREDMLAENTSVSQLTADLEHLLDTYRDLPLRNIPFGPMMTQTFDLFRSNHVRPPAQFTLTLKSLMTIESFARSLDPEFNIMEALRPYARRAAFHEFDAKQLFRHARQLIGDAGDLAARLPEDINVILTKFRQGKFQVRVHHEHLDHLARTIDKGSNRISFALIIAALLVASSMLVPQQGTVLGLFRLQTLGIAGYIIAAIIGVWLIISIIRSGRL